LLRTRRQRLRDYRAAKKGNESTALHIHPNSSGDDTLAAKTTKLIGAETGIGGFYRDAGSMSQMGQFRKS
jgi:hypothetical protein